MHLTGFLLNHFRIIVKLAKYCASHTNGQEAWCPGRKRRGAKSLWIQAEWGWQGDLVLFSLPSCTSLALKMPESWKHSTDAKHSVAHKQLAVHRNAFSKKKKKN